MFRLFLFTSCVIYVQAHQRCVRETNLKTIGKDFYGNDVVADVGECVVSFSNVESGYYVSVLQQILRKSEERNVCQKQSSEDEYKCSATSFYLDFHGNIIGQNKFIEIVKECGCKKIQKSCKKVNKKVTVFAEIENEITLNLPQCEGSQSNDGKSCQANGFIQFKVTGPKDIHVITGARSCEMKHECRRRKHNVVIRMRKTNKEGRRSIIHKVVDVGKCGGKCGSASKCILKGSGTCLMQLKSVDLSCTPKDIVRIAYLNVVGELNYISKIKTCQCS